MKGIFRRIVVCDTEYEVAPGGLPDLLCLVAYVLDESLRHIRTIRLWRGEFGNKPPFDVGPDTLFVAYSAWAELTIFKVMGWRFPVHVFDLHTAYLATSNFLLPYDPKDKRIKPGKALPDAARAYGIEGWENLTKKSMAKDIGEGLWRKYGQPEVFRYCEEDVRQSAELLRQQLRGRGRLLPVDTKRVMHWSNYAAKSIALVQSRGIPIDVVLWNLVQENKAAVINELLRQFDPSYYDDDPIYTRDGEFSYDRFERWLVRVGIIAWPRLESGQLQTDSDAFGLMINAHPGIEGLLMLRDSIGFIAKARLPIGPDGRNRPSLFPFGTATGRNAHSKSPFNAHAGVRGFIRFPPDSIGCYLDWRTQEVGIAASRSQAKALMADYSRGDVYHALARLCGLTNETDPAIWKQNNGGVRDRMKPLQLGINYGMGTTSLAKGLNRHPLIASGIIELHKRTYPQFWQWREDQMITAMLERRIESSFGWPMHLTSSPNKRTLYNFPMQSDGAEMLRLATWRMTEAGIIPVMLVHDGILLEVQNREQIEQAKEIMRAAGRDVCGGFEIGVDVDQMLIGGARYRDKRPMAQKMWDTIMRVLEAVGALSRSA